MALYGSQAGGGALEITDLGAAGFLKTQLGYSTRKIRDDSILKAVADPKKALDDYHTKAELLFEDAGKRFKVDYDKLIVLGFADTRAKEIATEKATNYVNDHIGMLNYEYPVTGDINTLASAVAKAGTNLHVAKEDGSGEVKTVKKRVRGPAKKAPVKRAPRKKKTTCKK
jgi:hypothetical protein